MAVVVLAAGLAAPALARADAARADVEASTFAWGGANDAVAYPGGQLGLSLWLGRLGLVLEGSQQLGERGGSMASLGLGARLEVARLPSAADTELNLFAEAGAARERWRLRGPLAGSEPLERRRVHVGGGFNYINPVSPDFHFGVLVWLRGQFAEAAGRGGETMSAKSSSSPMPELPERRALVFGAGVLAGW